MFLQTTSSSASESVSEFIATQGPLPHTIEDFWEMVIQQHCPVIVMLTRLVDNYKVLAFVCMTCVGLLEKEINITILFV